MRMKNFLRRAPGEKARPHSLRPLALCFLLSVPTSFGLRAQNINIGSTTAYDENIFDIYLPTSDQVTQFQLEASNDWDFDQLSLTTGYSGALELFRDLPARNYHLHVLSLAGLYHFENSREDDEQSPGPESAQSDSVSTLAGQQIPRPANGTAHSDSGDRYLSFGIIGASQFDRNLQTDFGNPSKYDNSVVEASASLREPLGIRFSARPSYTISYHTYPNVSAISNLQNILGLQFGSDIIPGGWVAVAPQYAVKTYTGSSSYTDTLTFRNSGGHGKGFGSGNGGVRARSFVFTSPSVKQVLVSLSWKQAIISGTELLSVYTRYAAPSGEARIIPQQLRGAPQERDISGLVSQNEIFDDHFAYSGNALLVQLTQSLPLGIGLRAQQAFQSKVYTVAAMDLADSITISAQRDDHRYETAITLSRPFALGVGKSLRPQIEFHHIRNDSNDPYYDFDKNVLLFGIEFAF